MKFKTSTTIIVHGARMALPATPTVVAVGGHEFGPLRRAAHVEAATPPEKPPVPPERLAARAAVEARLRRAGATLKRLPRPVELLHLRLRGSAWPNIVPGRAERLDLERERAEARARGLRADDRPRPAAPSPAAISELDEVLRWLLVFVAGDERAAIAGKLVGWGVRRLAKADSRRRSHSTWARIQAAAVTKILAALLAEASAKARRR